MPATKPVTLRIGIDFDDVISQTSKPLSRAASEYFGKEINLHASSQYKLEEILGISRKEASQAFSQISRHYSFHKQLPLLQNCKRVLFQLKEGGHKLFVISARSTLMLPHSTAWLKYHGLLPIISAIIHKPVDEENEEQYKALIAKELALNVLVEDAPHYAMAVAQAGIPVILFDAPYNRNTSFPKNVYRVKGWEDVPQIIKSLREELLTAV